MTQSVIETSRGISSRYDGITIAGRQTVVYAPGGAVSFSALASGARAAASRAGRAVVAGGRGVVSAGRRAVPYLGAAAYGVGKGVYGVGMGVTRAGAYTVDTKLMERRVKKGLPVGEGYVVYRPRTDDPESWRRPQLISGEAQRAPAYKTSGKDQIVVAPFNMACYSDRVAFAAGAQVIQRGQYYHCPICGQSLTEAT